MADINLKSLHPFLKQDDTKVSSGGTVKSYSHDTGSGPVVCLLHGYPQSAYMWRHTIPLLKDHTTLFVPEMPGYGISSLPPKPDKRTVGSTILEALQAIFGKDRPVIWCGHDRGARVGHRLIVDNDPTHNIKAAILLDIVPTTEQYCSFARPKAVVGSYHWPFLAYKGAPQLIEAMGGHLFAKDNFDRSKGKNPAGMESFAKDHAEDVYCHLFSQPETIAGSCADYASAAETEVDEQIQDQEKGNKIKVPTLVIYSAGYLGKNHKVDEIWPKWTDSELKCVGIPDDHGHYLPEETPEQVADLIKGWVEQHSQ